MECRIRRLAHDCRGGGPEGRRRLFVAHERIEATFGGRSVVTEFIPVAGAILVRETFETETSHSVEQQRQGWQAILDRFARHVEARKG